MPRSGIWLVVGSPLVLVRCCLHQVEAVTVSLIPVCHPAVPRRNSEDGADLCVSTVTALCLAVTELGDGTTSQFVLGSTPASKAGYQYLT